MVKGDSTNRLGFCFVTIDGFAGFFFLEHSEAVRESRKNHILPTPSPIISIKTFRPTQYLGLEGNYYFGQRRS